MKFPPNWRSLASILPLLFVTSAIFPATHLHGQESRPQPTPQPPAQPPVETLFSGPQPGEPAEGFEVLGVFPPLENQKFDFLAQAKDKPLLLIFVHDLNRQSIGFTRILGNYAASRASDGLETGIVWLDDDTTNAIATLRRTQHAFPKNVPVGISVDGREGPGSYGLNRKSTLTILLLEKNKTIANHALIQPSLQADLPIVLQTIVAKIGGQVPPMESLEGMPRMESASTNEPPNLRPWLTPIIRRDASDESIVEAATKLETFLQDNPAAQKEIGRITSTILNAGKLENYGTPKTQSYFKKWASQYGPKPNEKKQTDAPKR